MSDHVTFVCAGAGSGKTTRIEKELTGLIEAGAIAADRILAVTFTESAAAELKGRLRGALMAAGRIEDALAIDQAYVGTIHGLGLRLLTEHAFATGRSPALRLISDAERELLIRLEGGRSAALAPLRGDLERFGYAWDGVSGKSAEAAFRAQVIATVDLLRGLGPRGTDRRIVEGAEAEVRRLYGECIDDPKAATARLAAAVDELMRTFPRGIVECASSDGARKDFRNDSKALQTAHHSPGDLSHDWRLWQALRELRLSRRGCPTPAGYDALAGRVIAAADVLPRHPGPLEDACRHLRALVHGAQEAMAAYARAKAAAGLIDYADMIAETEAILRTRPELLRAVVGELDCVVIDEFQDTNPVQFALLWRLARHAPRCLIVGDTKQSIMGFQGADARLSRALETALPGRVEPLRKNWRSTPPLMALVNVLGAALFADGYVPLEPQRAVAGLPWLEVVHLPGSKARPATAGQAVAARIAAMLAEGDQVTDRATEETRALRPADIAILCYRHSQALAQAEALRALGLPVRILAEGWRESLATRIACHALAIAADPHDAHAAIAFLTLGPPRLPLAEALRSQMAGTLLEHLALAPLRLAGSESLPVAVAAARAVARAGLWDWVGGIEDAAAARADLCRFLAEAEVFDGLASELTAAAGYFGRGAASFLGWLAAQTADDFNCRPDPDGWSSEGIEIVTWHAAKGREWPVTVVADLGYDWGERGNSLRGEFDGFDDVDNVLDRAGLGFTPRFADPGQTATFRASRRSACEAEACRLVYVAMTRARDRLVLAVPPAPRSERTDFASLLRSRCGLVVGTDSLGLAGTTFPARVTPAPAAMPAVYDTAPGPCRVTATRFGESRPRRDGPRTPWRISPSTLSLPAPPAGRLRHVALGPKLVGRSDGFALATERGTAWHLAFRTFAVRPDLAARLPAATGLEPPTLEAIAAQAEAVRTWLHGLGFADLAFELPVQIAEADGSEVNGVVDCLASGPSGRLVLDHKSGPAPDPAARFESYRPQLMAYAAAVGRLMHDRPVTAVAIHWMNEGTVTVCDFEPALVEAR
jgi:ATP-dependent exoDNAse (exonuclease V) beta subunit